MTRSPHRLARAARVVVLALIILAPGGTRAEAPPAQAAPQAAPVAGEPVADAPPAAAEPVGSVPGEPVLPSLPSAAGASVGLAAELAQPAALPLVLPPLERAWALPGAPLERAARVRAAADALGLADVEPVARALLVEPGTGPALERARAAVLAAPGLPAAQLALARAEWRDGTGLGAALAAAGRALSGLPRHLESWLWLEATALTLVYTALLAAGLLWIAARGGLAATHAAHDLADRLDPDLPGFARAAFVAVLVLAPAALGEGPLGAALALFAIAWWAGDTRQRRALTAAAALVALALGPLAGAAGRALGSVGADPVVLAAVAAETGFLDPADAARLARAEAAGDPLAQRVNARRARRAGDLARAEALLQPLLEGGPADPGLLNDAAHVKLLAGDTRGAIALYERALALRPSADLWFNLAQAHVRAIDMEAHAAALEAAQETDARRTRELTARLAASEDTLLDLPLSRLALRARAVAAADPAVGAALRAPVAPGLLGRSPWLAPLLFAALAGLAGALARATHPSRGCRDCGARLCPRCASGDPGEGLCSGCARRRLAARHGGPWEARGEGGGAPAVVAHALRAAARVLPGLVDPEPARPGLALAALAALAAAAALWVGRAGVAVDPAAVGGGGPLAFSVAAGVLLVAGVALTAWSRREGRH